MAESKPKRVRLEVEKTLTKSVNKEGIVVDLPEGWHCHADSVLVHTFGAPKASAKIAAFDFDGCLANTKFGNDPDAWKMRYENGPDRLNKLVEEGFKFVIFTNESTDRLKSKDSLEKAIRKKTGRLEGFLKAAGAPCQVYVMLRKDEFRKPETAVWTLMESHNDGVTVSLADSFFVGDAAGRPKDHDDCDKMFAKNVGVDFHTDDAFFKGKK